MFLLTDLTQRYFRSVSNADPNFQTVMHLKIHFIIPVMVYYEGFYLPRPKQNLNNLLKLYTKRITFSNQNTPAPSVFFIQIFLYFSAKEELIGFFIKLLTYVTAAIIAFINQNPSKNESLETLSGRISSLQFFSKSSSIELIMSTISSYHKTLFISLCFGF